jgi:hypothetical protein
MTFKKNIHLAPKKEYTPYPKKKEHKKRRGCCSSTFVKCKSKDHHTFRHGMGKHESDTRIFSFSLLRSSRYFSFLRRTPPEHTSYMHTVFLPSSPLPQPLFFIARFHFFSHFFNFIHLH